MQRAVTEAQKRAVCDLLYDAWCNNQAQRLGQLLVNKFGEVNLFNIEDGKLAETLQRMAK